MSNEQLRGTNGTDAAVATTDLIERMSEISAKRLPPAERAAYQRKRAVASRLSELSGGVLSVCYWPSGWYYGRVETEECENLCAIELDDLDEDDLRLQLVAEVRATSQRWNELADAIEVAIHGQG